MLGNFQFPFATFGGVDFTSVTSVTLQISGEDGSDLELDSFSVQGQNGIIPEPASVLVWSFLIGIAVGIRRR
jgi:hypothetical protein